ncbi:FAD-binding oxidoreductase [Catenulispora sp. NL8]|uniref:FAD-binding oxidoreductase n=1 Tax=Catenulispora pinistramenti TaxID=2705254 RepID=A0ABS5L2K8_9ACTN|nr:FAD-dependent oxidoreductase [Catenulispora pinistramenti]MBS2552404.1 FAD-binding oxidoreductase [Catenulispora pinistramenti]
MGSARAAVVGGGIFGITAAVQLARAGHRVDLFEQSAELLSGASFGNQRRLHRGYHYPRGMETASAALRAVKAFEAEYPGAVHETCAHYVAISKRDSLVSAEQYMDFCAAAGLRFREEYPSFIRRSSVDICLRIAESLIDVDRLRGECRGKLASAGVDVRLRTRADRRILSGYDLVVLATYADLNRLRIELGHGPQVFQFEVCEKPVARLPDEYRNTSLVIMDGPFMCVDPVAGSPDFLLGNVDHAIVASTVGYFPLIPRSVARHVHSGVVIKPKPSRFDDFVGSAKEFLVGFDQAIHRGSIFTIRTVLPHMEATDDRPTLVRSLDERTFVIFGGKITTCVEAAHELAAQISTRSRSALPVPR